MDQAGFLVAWWMTLAMAAGVSGAEAQGRLTDLRRLADRLDLTDSGVRRWLEQLEVTADGPHTERLLAVSATGEPLLERHGERSSVRVDPELDTLLLRPEMAIVLVHNHPASAGLSVADLRQLEKPGVAAIVALGHDGSVFIASAGPRLDRVMFEDRQYARAKAETLKRLRAEWPSGRVSVAVSDAHFSHLVTLALARAGVVQYWFKLGGSGRESYEQARIVFSEVVVGVARRLKNP